ncbi:MAG: metallophosphoesterase [Aquificaceae bacterium]|nr:metallophosphoesterase [Aquificaceae bacterium]
MTWFIPIFLIIYALLHLYVYARLIKQSVKNRALKILTLGMLFLGFSSPFLWRYADTNLGPHMAYITALSGLLWVGFLFYKVFFTFLLDFYKGFVLFSKRFLGINPLPLPSPRISLFLVLILSLTFSAYSYYETLNLKVERHTIHTEKLPKDVKSVKILHISDLHLGPVMGMDKIMPVLEIYQREKPHIVVSTGDLVDGNMKNKIHLARALAQMDPPFGKYAVLGNHEYYRGVEQAVEFTKSAGFRLLRGDSFHIEELNITMVGIDDDDCKIFRKCVGTLSDLELLQKHRKDSFLVYLKHKPRLEKGAHRLFDLMLSGHTHGGIYYPVGRFILTKMFISDRGFHRIDDSFLYISKGVGTGGPPMRLFSHPDVAIIELVNRQR